jgi:RNA ligase (TIGR02306 family)
MSTLVVEVCRIEQVGPHHNADALELAQIKGWQCVIPKGKYAEGDLVTYIPIDAMIPEEHSDRWGITQYLSKGRVRCARLRSEPSFGVIVEREDPGWELGTDVAEHYGVTKYEPPVNLWAQSTGALPPHPLFEEYTDVENLRNYPDVLVPGEDVIVTEKIHGTNSRIGIVQGEWMAGSRQVRRERPENLASSVYGAPMLIPEVAALLEHFAQDHRQVVLYGEIFGSKVQSLHYGASGADGFQAFDLMIDGHYLNAFEFRQICVKFSVAMVPILYEGPYAIGIVKALSEGNTTLGAEHIREGVVVKPVTERRDPKVGRVCMKYIGDSYLFAKNVTDSKDI